jgi:diguanylate cyclase (GGDEF)-like protein
VNPFFFLTKQGGLRRKPFAVVTGALALVTGVVAIALSLVWPIWWPMFALLQAVGLAVAVYTLASRIMNVKRPAAADPLGAPTGLVDDLTRTLNRRGIVSSLIEAMAQSQRYGTPLSLISLGIDGAQTLMEHLGPEAESPILEAVSAALGEVLRLPDRLGRYQGWEFLVVLPQTRTPQALLVAERLRVAVSGIALTVKGEKVAVTMSAGIAEFGRGQDLERFLANAHEALYEAQRAGGNQAHAFASPPRAKGGAL